jgi:hypothetical protein
MSTDVASQIRDPDRTPSIIAVLLSVWLGASTWVLGYPITIHGQDAALRDRGLTLALLFTATCWMRATRHRRGFLLAHAAFAVLLFIESFLAAYGPGGSLSAPWWNEKIVAGVLLLACAVGWFRAPAVETSLRRA